MPATSELVFLQELLLRAVLLGQVLPGLDSPVNLPDLDFIVREPAIFVAEENLAGRLSAEGLGKPLRILAEAELKNRAQQRGDTAYLRFAEPVVEDGRVRVTMAAHIAPQDPERQVLGLSSVGVLFGQSEDGWEVLEGPLYTAF